MPCRDIRTFAERLLRNAACALESRVRFLFIVQICVKHPLEKSFRYRSGAVVKNVPGQLFYSRESLSKFSLQHYGLCPPESNQTFRVDSWLLSPRLFFQ